MRVRASVKRLCRNCKVIRRNGTVRVICQGWSAQAEAGLRESVRQSRPATDIWSFNGNIPQWQRIAGVNIPDRKHVWVALTHIYGIGRTRAFDICTATGVAPDVAVRSLTETELDALRGEVAKRDTEGDLRREVSMNIKRLMDLGCYRGIRHRRGVAGTRPAHPHQRPHQKGPPQTDQAIKPGLYDGKDKGHAPSGRYGVRSATGSRTSTLRSTTP